LGQEVRVAFTVGFTHGYSHLSPSGKGKTAQLLCSKKKTAKLLCSEKKPRSSFVARKNHEAPLEKEKKRTLL
jgi:hypothetical protein